MGLSLGIMFGYDENLKAGGRDALFAPILGSTLDKVLPKTDISKLKQIFIDSQAAYINYQKSGEVITQLLKIQN